MRGPIGTLALQGGEDVRIGSVKTAVARGNASSFLLSRELLQHLENTHQNPALAGPRGAGISFHFRNNQICQSIQ